MNVTFEPEKGNTAGSWSRDGNTMNIDYGKVDSQAREVAKNNNISVAVARGHVGAAVLAHEGKHAIYRGNSAAEGGYWGYQEEKSAYYLQWQYYDYMGISGNVNGWDDVFDGALRSCTGRVQGRSDPGGQYADGCRSGYIEDTR